MDTRENREQPRSLKDLFAAAKDTSELMLDLAYAALVYNDTDPAKEVLELEDQLSELVHRMREVSLLASRSLTDATELAGFLQIVSSVELLGNQAVDIAKIVTKQLGIPTQIRAELATAVEVSDRIRVRSESDLDGRGVHDTELTAQGIRLLAIRREGEWLFDPADTQILTDTDLILVRGPADALARVRDLAGEPQRPDSRPAARPDDLEHALDALIEMKDLSELAVALAYATVLAGAHALAIEVNRLEGRLDQMRETVESWVLDAATERGVRSSLRGLLHLAVAAETVGDAAQAMVWLTERGENLHPVIADALIAAEDTVSIRTVMPDAVADGTHLGDLHLLDRLGVTALGLQHAERWHYRPRPTARLAAGDQLILAGPTEALDDAHALLTESGESA